MKWSHGFILGIYRVETLDAKYKLVCINSTLCTYMATQRFKETRIIMSLLADIATY